MATTPSLGLPYPVGTAPTEFALWTQSLAEKIESVLTTQIQHGTVPITGNGTTTQTVNVVFPVPFAAAPKVCASTAATAHAASVNAISATGMTLNVVRRDNETWTGSTFVYWVATNL